MFRRHDRADAELISQINSVAAALARANSAVSHCGDPLLLESTVYEIKYLKARYAYLLKTAKENGVCADSISKVKGGI